MFMWLWMDETLLSYIRDHQVDCNKKASVSSLMASSSSIECKWFQSIKFSLILLVLSFVQFGRNFAAIIQCYITTVYKENRAIIWVPNRGVSYYLVSPEHILPLFD